MDGGIKAWKGLVVEGVPETGIAYFSSGRSAAEFILLSWLLEEGTRSFYGEIKGNYADQKAGMLMEALVEAEENHKRTLEELHESLTGLAFDAAILPAKLADRVMEGGVSVGEALAWTEGRKLREVLEFALSLEAISYDRYVEMSRLVIDEGAKRVFGMLSKEEKKHLEKLTDLFDDELSG